MLTYVSGNDIVFGNVVCDAADYLVGTENAFDILRLVIRTSPLFDLSDPLCMLFLFDERQES